MGWYSYNHVGAELSDLVGKTLTSVENTGDEVKFVTEDGETYLMLHYQDCCEYVRVEDVCGDLDDLVGSPIVLAEDVSNEAPEPKKDDDGWGCDSETWTFYKLATNKGSVTIRWYGTSNGYYSESVDFVKVKAEEATEA